MRFLTGRAHPALLPADLVRGPAGRVAIVRDPKEGTLAGRLRHCHKVGSAGVPRRELLDYLATVADLLDALYHEHRLQHLCLNPHALALDGKDVLVADAGLGGLLWLPAGQPLGRLNGHYAAPELCAGEVSPACDRYSLAVILQEMLTGTVPFPVARARGKARPNLDLLPVPDRAVLTRALHADPARRFGSCAELIGALDRGTAASRTRPAPVVLPAVIPVPGPAPAPAAGSLPARASLVGEMVARAAGGFEMCQGDGLRYLLRPGKVLKHSCGARLPASLAHLKLEAFCQHWRAVVVQGERGSFMPDLPPPLTFWHRCLGRRPALRVNVCLTAPKFKSQALTGVHIEVWPSDCRGEQAALALARLGPEVLHSLRTFLYAEPERHSQERLPFDHALGIFPVLDEGPCANALVCRGKDVSADGLGLLASREPRSDRVYVQSLLTPELSGLALLGRVVRVQRRGDELFEIGMSFADGSDMPR